MSRERIHRKKILSISDIENMDTFMLGVDYADFKINGRNNHLPDDYNNIRNTSGCIIRKFILGYISRISEERNMNNETKIYHINMMLQFLFTDLVPKIFLNKTDVKRCIAGWEEFLAQYSGIINAYNKLAANMLGRTTGVYTSEERKERIYKHFPFNNVTLLPMFCTGFLKTNIDVENLVTILYEGGAPYFVLQNSQVAEEYRVRPDILRSFNNAYRLYYKEETSIFPPEIANLVGSYAYDIPWKEGRFSYGNGNGKSRRSGSRSSRHLRKSR